MAGSTLLDFVMDLVHNKDAAAAYGANPTQVLHDAGLADVSTADIAALLPLAGAGASPPVGTESVWSGSAATHAFDAVYSCEHTDPGEAPPPADTAGPMPAVSVLAGADAGGVDQSPAQAPIPHAGDCFGAFVTSHSGPETTELEMDGLNAMDGASVTVDHSTDPFGIAGVQHEPAWVDHVAADHGEPLI